jgi:hypothetical protein
MSDPSGKLGGMKRKPSPKFKRRTTLSRRPKPSDKGRPVELQEQQRALGEEPSMSVPDDDDDDGSTKAPVEDGSLRSQLWKDAFDDPKVQKAFDRAELLEDKDDPRAPAAVKKAEDLHDQKYHEACERRRDELTEEDDRAWQEAEDDK